MTKVSASSWLGAHLLYNPRPQLVAPRNRLGGPEGVVVGQVAVPSVHNQDGAMPAAQSATGIAELVGTAAAAVEGDPRCPIFASAALVLYWHQ